MDTIADHIAWMAWTWQTMLFFAGIARCARGPDRPGRAAPRDAAAGHPALRHDARRPVLRVAAAAAFIFLGFIRFGGRNFL